MNPKSRRDGKYLEGGVEGKSSGESLGKRSVGFRKLLEWRITSKESSECENMHILREKGKWSRTFLPAAEEETGMIWLRVSTFLLLILYLIIIEV